MPAGYEVKVFAAGLDTPSSATVDKDGNLWVAISGKLLGGPDPIDEAHVKVFDKDGKLLKEIGKGTFTTVMNEIGYCAENDTMYIPEYGEKIWEIKGVDGELTQIVKDLPIGDHRNGGITCKDGYLYFAVGLPSNTGFADPDNHGWTDIPNDPFWMAHDDGLGTTPHDPVCRDIEHTGLNIRSSDGRVTGALMPVGVAAKPGQVVKAQVPCGGSIMRVNIADKGADGLYPHEKMEVYAFGFRNQAGVAFGPKGTKWENALAVSDNGANDLGHRRIANGPEKLFIVTEMGQDAGYPDKEGFGFVTNKRFGWRPTAPRSTGRIRSSISARSRSSPRCFPTVSSPPPGRARRSPDRRKSQSGRLHQPGARMGHQQPDRRDRLERAGFRRRQQSVRRSLRHPRHRAGKPGPDLAGGAARRIPGAGRRQMVGVRPQHRAWAERLSETREPRRPGAAERRRLQQ